jgi:hypothetical protein
MTLTTIGYGDVTATNDAESIWMTLSMMFSSFVYAYAIGEVCGIVATMDEASREFNKQSDMLNYFCEENEIPQELTMRLREYFRYYKQVHRTNFYKVLLTMMSPALRGEVSVQINSSLAKSVSFFNAEDEAERARFLAAMTTTMTTELFGAQEVVISVGSRMKGVYLVRSGIACGGKNGTIFSTGSWFGTEGLLQSGRYRYQVRTLNILRVEIILKRSLDEIMWSGDFPQTYALMRKAFVKLLFKQNIVRVAKIIKPQQLKAAKRGSVESAVLSAAQIEEIKYGDLEGNDLHEQRQQDRAQNVSLPDVLHVVTDLARSVARIKEQLNIKTQGSNEEVYKGSNEEILDMLKKIQWQQTQMQSDIAMLRSQPSVIRSIPPSASTTTVQSIRGPPAASFGITASAKREEEAR